MWRVGVALVWLLRRLRVVDTWGVWPLPEPTCRLLKGAESIEVFSLGGVSEEKGPFWGAPVLGSVVVRDERLRRRLADRIILAHRYNIGGMWCLGAEYGLRVRAGEKSIDMTFCFGCSKVWVTGPAEYEGTGTTAAYPVPLLNRILTDAGVPLPPMDQH